MQIRLKPDTEQLLLEMAKREQRKAAPMADILVKEAIEARRARNGPAAAVRATQKGAVA